MSQETAASVLLTGARGYIGTVLGPVLLDAGFAVTGLDNGLFDDCTFGVQPAQPPFDRLDVRDITPKHLVGYDAVVHLAGLCNDPMGSLNPALTAAINLDATLQLARMAREVGVRRFIFASSCSLYGAGGEDLVTEDSPLQPLTPYAESKARSEEGLSALADDEFSPVYMRNATVYGASPRLRADLVLNNLVGWAVATTRVRLLSDGRAWRPLLHVRDLASACLALLTAPAGVVHDRAFNIGRVDGNVLIRDLANRVGELLPGTEVEISADASADSRSYRVDFGRMTREVPAYRPEWDVTTGIIEMAAFYRSAGLSLEQFTGGGLNRVTRLHELIAANAVGDDLRPRDLAPVARP